MSKAESRSTDRRTLAAAISRLARWIADFAAECHYAARRSVELASSPDMFLNHPSAAPDTYDEFLFRTSGLRRHEPPASERAHS